jgi:hypothetical protein
MAKAKKSSKKYQRGGGIPTQRVNIGMYPPPIKTKKDTTKTETVKRDTVKADTTKKKPVIISKKSGGSKFPDLTGDGKVTRADILKGRGVIKKHGGVHAGMADRYKNPKSMYQMGGGYREQIRDMKDFMNRPTPGGRTRFPKEGDRVSPTPEEANKRPIPRKRPVNPPKPVTKPIPSPSPKKTKETIIRGGKEKPGGKKKSYENIERTTTYKKGGSVKKYQTGGTSDKDQRWATSIMNAAGNLRSADKKDKYQFKLQRQKQRNENRSDRRIHNEQMQKIKGDQRPGVSDVINASQSKGMKKGGSVKYGKKKK